MIREDPFETMSEEAILLELESIQATLMQLQRDKQIISNDEPHFDELLVSVTLPVELVIGEDDDSWDIIPSKDSLVGNNSFLDSSLDEFHHSHRNALWVGLIVTEKPVNTKTSLKVKKKLLENRMVPVFIDSSQYRIFMESTLSLLIPQDFQIKSSLLDTFGKEYHESAYFVTKKICGLIAEEISRVNTAAVIITSSSLSFIPLFLQNQSTTIHKTAIYMNHPFPNVEFARHLRNRSELLQSLLLNDVVVFSSESFRMNFLRACTKLLENQSTPNKDLLISPHMR